MEILCVKKSTLTKSSALQKDNSIIKGMMDSFKFIEEEDVPKDYVPVDIAVTVRSAYTNKVVMCTHSDSDEERCFLNLTKIPKTPQEGYDLIMFISSIAVMKMCDPTKIKEISEVMMNSKYDLLGVINLEPNLMNPIIYSHIILKDSTLKDFESLLAEGFKIIPISDLPEKGNFKAMRESLIICKEEENE